MLRAILATLSTLLMLLATNALATDRAMPPTEALVVSATAAPAAPAVPSEPVVVAEAAPTVEQRLPPTPMTAAMAPPHPAMHPRHRASEPIPSLGGWMMSIFSRTLARVSATVSSFANGDADASAPSRRATPEE